jgi:site-specific recombinase XerD
MTFHLSTVQVWSVDRSELQETLQLWLESMQARGLSPKTLRNYSDTVGRFIRFLESLNLRTLDAVQPVHIRKWLIHRQAQGVSSYELHNAYRQPRTFWRWCLREGLTENDAFAKVEKPRLKMNLKPALTPEEVQALLNACEGTDWLRKRDRALLLLLLDTGLRIHEAHALTVGDAKRECLLIRGKGGKQRMVFLSPETRLALRKYLQACPHALQEDSPLWWGRYGALTLHGLLEAIQKLGKRAGMPKHLGAHVFRRTYATWSLRSGIDLETLRQLLGHSDFASMKHYLALVESDLKRAHQQHSPVNHLLRRK